jgi:hypothetical protein
MSYDQQEEMILDIGDDFSEQETVALSLPPLGKEGTSMSNAGKGDEVEFEEIVQGLAHVKSQAYIRLIVNVLQPAL